MSSIIKVFPDYIKTIADGLALSYWDWSAIILACISLLVAVFSFIVAKKTLCSQRRTEINTSPIINKTVQLFLLNTSLRELYESLVSMIALYASLEHMKYTIFPSRQFWDMVHIDTSILHEELFYGNDSKFKSIYYLKSYLNKFNSDVMDLENCIDKFNISSALKKTIILHICEDIGNLVQLWGKCYTNTLGLTKNEVTSLLNDNFFNCNFCRFNHVLNDDKELILHYLPNSPFTKQVEYIIELLSSRFEILKTLFSLDYNECTFKTTTVHHVDSLMLNILYNNYPFAAHVIKCEAKPNQFSDVSSHSENPYFRSEYVPNTHLNYSWIFYFKDLTKR